MDCSSFTAHNWFIDRETAPTAAETDLEPYILGAPLVSTIHPCGGMSRVQIINFITGAHSETNVHKIYAIDPVATSASAGKTDNIAFAVIPLVSILFLSGTQPGLGSTKVASTKLFSDGVIVTEIASVAYDMFKTVDATDADYSTTINDIGVATIQLPGCWGLITTWLTKDASTTDSNLLLKFS